MNRNLRYQASLYTRKATLSIISYCFEFTIGSYMMPILWFGTLSSKNKFAKSDSRYMQLRHRGYTVHSYTPYTLPNIYK